MTATHPPDAPDGGLAARLAAAQDRVAAAARSAGRDPAEVRLLLASKRMPAAVVRDAVLAGGTLLGENTVQELVAKAPELADLRPRWHLIGHLQSNKVNAALRWADCVQSVDTLPLAERLSRRCGTTDRDLDVMVQVNVSGEPSKSGVEPVQAVELARAVAALPRLRLVGLMTIGAATEDDAVVREGFARLRGLRDEVLASGAPGTAAARELSMGMSGDLEVAVEEGSTMVRIGTAVFGARPRQADGAADDAGRHGRGAP
ncbi:YggS family pyridoxal phosphate-dependent enzyme [Actinotalea sp. Marseille-Q4924]|uniref:YggS family pyridoxal phosphate-dependent enzyme n=1 Tax=Actinotalea sp. Marseille-Q4924 TaxID=2866571 RepID=UPI001CE3C16B|nr:YggS family pyridoxal phosphate-dependent enzyme [Actinotalea sp. Marseille-Q4924]